MAYKKGILLGRVTKTAGFDGTVIVKLEKDIVENLPLMETVFLEIDGRPVPFFISSFDYPGGDVVKLTFSGYNSPEMISEFKGCSVYLVSGPGDEVKTENENLVGYTLIDQKGKKIGIIAEIIENPGQLLIRVKDVSKKEYLVPLHEDLIISIDKKKRLLLMDLPEGITDL